MYRLEPVTIAGCLLFLPAHLDEEVLKDGDGPALGTSVCRCGAQ